MFLNLLCIFLLFKYSCLHFHLTLAPAPPIPASHPRTQPLWLCPCVLHSCSLMDLHLFPAIIPVPPPLWLLSVCSLFQCESNNMFIVTHLQGKQG